MRKMVMLAAMMALAALMLAAAPALAVEDNDRRDNNNNNENSDFGDFVDGFGDLEELFQTSEQEAESGEVDQTFDITGGGDNSNQCVGAQGVANTGNAQISLNILNFGELDDFELEDLESSLTVDPTNTTTCDQEVNQAASAFGGYDY